MLGIAGLILAIGRPCWLLILLVLAPMQLTRAKREARVRKEKFGDECRTHRRTTWF